MNQIDLKGRVAIVTGGLGGIGQAITARFKASGAKVVTWDMAEGADNVLDVTDEAQVASSMARVLKAHGKLDILVNCAGITGPAQKLEAYSLADWRRTLDANLTSTFLCCRAAVPAMRQHKYGRIVNLASIAGKEGNPNLSAYSSAKAAVIAMTKVLGKELVGTNILVNAIAPAVIETAILKQMTPETVAALLSKIPMGRPGTTDEVAALVAWLSSDDCSFSTGATFDLSGGRATY